MAMIFKKEKKDKYIIYETQWVNGEKLQDVVQNGYLIKYINGKFILKINEVAFFTQEDIKIIYEELQKLNKVSKDTNKENK